VTLKRASRTSQQNYQEPLQLFGRAAEPPEPYNRGGD
jgi:hypothetical protein